MAVTVGAKFPGIFRPLTSFSGFPHPNSRSHAAPIATCAIQFFVTHTAYRSEPKIRYKDSHSYEYYIADLPHAACRMPHAACCVEGFIALYKNVVSEYIATELGPVVIRSSKSAHWYTSAMRSAHQLTVVLSTSIITKVISEVIAQCMK